MLSSFFDFIGDVGGSLFSTDGKLDPGKLGGIAALLGSSGGFNLAPGLFSRPDQPVGYQGSVPNYTAVRRRVPITDDPNRRPGSGGRRYFTDMQYATTPESEPKTLEEAQAAAEEQIQQLSLAQAPKGISSVIPSTTPPVAPMIPSPAAAVIETMPVPTFSAKPLTGPKMGTGSSTPGGVVLQQSEETPRTQGMAAGGIASAQDQAKKDAAALGITIDEYYSLPFKERLGLAKKDIGEVFNPSLGPLLQNPNNVDPENARSLGILSLPKPPAPAPAPIPAPVPAPVPEITQENLPKAPVPQPTPKGPRDFPFFGLDPSLIPPSSDTTIPPATYQGRGVPPKPPKPKLGDFKGSLNKNDAFRKRQKERREWDKKYGDKYNDDGTLKLDNKSFINELLEKFSLSLENAGTRATQNMAAGGLAGLKKGKYLNGATDGMADKIPATIDRTQPAALSDGEYVITADVVSHLGNGNSDAGAKVLDGFMEDVRMARTGTKKQGKEIDPQKFLPKV